MARRLPRKDVVIVGLGWTGSIMALELARTGLEVVAIERGPWRDTASDFNIGTAPDELRYAVRHDVFLRPKQETLTMRNNPSQTALPIRRWGSFLPGNGVGGAGVHWNGQTWRFLPDDFRMRSHMIERYGEGIMPEGHQIQDWGVSYEDLEPYYDKFEYVAGISGKAGNIKGVKQAGGNFFEGAREREYPTPPMTQGYAQTLFTKAAGDLGLHPFPRPSANISVAYTNPYGCSMAPCTYCGFCERFGCSNYSKASPQTCVLPALVREPTFEARTECEVTKVNLAKDGKTATGVTYVDLNGEEWEQPADIVLVCAYALFNVRLLLLSGIGKPYDPATGEGVVGRNYAYQTGSGSTAFFEDAKFNPFAAAGSLGAALDDYNSDNFDHGPHGFVGGASITCAYTNGRPIQYHPVPRGTPAWGSAVEEGGQGNLPARHQCRRAGQRDELPQQLSRPRPDLQGSARPSPNADDVRLSAKRAEDGELDGRSLRRDRESDGRQDHANQPPQRALERGAVPVDAQYRRRGHGRRSQDQRAQPLSAVMGRLERVRDGRVGVSAECRL